MRAVTRFEANLVRVMRAVLTDTPAEPLAPLFARPCARPKCLTRDAVDLLEDTFRKGTVHWLARQGWRRERFLRAGVPVMGRLWERAEPDPPGVAFSHWALEFLVQFVSGTVGSMVPKLEELSLGDRLVICLTYRWARPLSVAETLRKKWTPLIQDGLSQLAFVEDFADGSRKFRIDWQTWATGPGSYLLEAMQGWLAERWIELERKKGALRTSVRMDRIGAAQERVLGEFSEVIAAQGRKDLARWILAAGSSLFRDSAAARDWFASLDVSAERLGDRYRIYRSALAFVRHFERMHGWQQQALSVGYFDEDYAASQLWKSDWERFEGDRLCERASALVRAIEPL